MPRKRASTASSSPLRNGAASRKARRNGHQSAAVYAKLRQQILGGVYPPGWHLSQQAIAREMHTSNGPVITALRRLAHEGLVVHSPGHGCHVCHWSAEELDDQLNLRRALETEAARLAARRASPEDLELLRGIIERMRAVVAEGRRADADAVDVEFHVAVARLTRSPRLIEALDRCHILDVVRRRLAANERFGDFQKLAENHLLLVEAIASGDPDRAGKAMHEHLLKKRAKV
jgi:DNA-binding GntR family transcriptional regulator